MSAPKLRNRIVSRVEVDQVATGRNNRAWRECLGVSLRSAALLMKISAPYLSDLELGQRHWNEELQERFTIAVLTIAEDRANQR